MKAYLFILMISIFLFSLISCDKMSKNKNTLIFKEREIFENTLKEKSQYIDELAKILSLDQEIISVYQATKKKVRDLSVVTSQNREVFYRYGKDLKEIFEKKIRIYEKEVSFPLNYHFFLPPSRSWLKPELPFGEDITLRDFGQVRPVLIEIFNKKNYSSGFEAIENKVIYRALMPIWDSNGEILGILEVSSDLDNFIINYLQDNSKKEVLTYIDKSLINFFQNKIILKNSILYFSNTEMNKSEYENLYELLKNSNDVLTYNKKEYIIIPLIDYRGNTLGQILISRH